MRGSFTDMARYGLLQRLLHWLIAALVFAALLGGLVLWAYGFDGLKSAFGIEVTNLVYKYHKTAGVLILGLMTLRLAVRLVAGAPAAHPSLSPPLAAVSAATHWVLYALLFAMPVLGWLATAAGGFPVEFFDMKMPGLIGKDPALSKVLYWSHGALGLAIAVVMALHVAAALRHWLVLKDGVMRRISLP
ncbi:MAG: cytochrome b [Pseudomonadota bacterium]